MFRPENVARKIQGGPGRDTKLIIKGRCERRTGQWYVARMPTRPVHRLPSSMPVFVTHGGLCKTLVIASERIAVRNCPEKKLATRRIR